MGKNLTAVLFLIILGIFLALPNIVFAYSQAVFSYEGKSFTFNIIVEENEIKQVYVDVSIPNLNLTLGWYDIEAFQGMGFTTVSMPEIEPGEPIVGEPVRGGMGFVSAHCRFRHDLSDYPAACCGWDTTVHCTPSNPCWVCMRPPWGSMEETGWPRSLGKDLTPCCLIDRILTIGDYIFVGLLIVAIIVILLAAWQFLTSAGEPDKAKKARSFLLYAVIGIAIAFLAKAAVKVIAAIVGS